MPLTETLRPGIAAGRYPERAGREPEAMRRALQGLGGSAKTLLARYGSRPDRIAALVNAAAPDDGISERQFQELVANLRSDFLGSGLSRALVARAFALTREAGHRALGMRHFDTQLAGGWVMLHGMLAEMDTGEGKTLAATLPACTAALAGIPVHVVTVNDYLAERDARAMRPLYGFLGLSVGCVKGGMSPAHRRQAYACDVTYCTSKELAFDYLRDRIVMGVDRSRMQLELECLHAPDGRMNRLVMRGLCFAIVDEADSVLIDEARTPLLIARPGRNREVESTLRHALVLSEALVRGEDFECLERDRQIRLSDRGRARLDELTRPLGGVWTGRRRRELLIVQALTARCLFFRDRHYLVQDEKVLIVDENTGRLMPDRAWERGLHQLIQVKEGCPVTGDQETIARTTYQHFFRRYLRLSGMTGTGREVAGELGSVYRLPVVRIPTHRPSRRQAHRTQTYRARESKWAAVTKRVLELNGSGRPVLIGTRTVEASEQLAEELQAAGVPHRVLNARQHASEAELIAGAGELGAVTVATNMAGRGTDIRLGPGAEDWGGLHVIAAERNESRRIDRQLFGRCGRQGDPGSYEALVSLDEDLPVRFCPTTVLAVARALATPGGTIPAWLACLITWLSQAAAAREHRLARSQLLRSEGQLNELLAFTGRMD